MQGRLKTVPLKELLGEPREKPAGFWIAMVAVVLVDALVLGAVLWSLLH